MPCTLSMNGYAFALHTLADTGAEAFLIINRPLAVRLSKALRTPIELLPYCVPLKGFKGGVQAHAEQYIRLHLTIDGRKIYNCPFVILDLNQEVIIGIKWMRRFRLDLDTVKSRFKWPVDHPPTESWAKEILLHHSNKTSKQQQQVYQRDAERRDQYSCTTN